MKGGFDMTFTKQPTGKYSVGGHGGRMYRLNKMKSNAERKLAACRGK